jgi:hypothetical protein
MGTASGPGSDPGPPVLSERRLSHDYTRPAAGVRDEAELRPGPPLAAAPLNGPPDQLLAVERP